MSKVQSPRAPFVEALCNCEKSDVKAPAGLKIMMEIKKQHSQFSSCDTTACKH